MKMLAYLLAEQDPADQWLEQHPEVLGALILVVALVNVCIGIGLFVSTALVLRATRLSHPVGRLAAFLPAIAWGMLTLFMLLFSTYLLCGGNPRWLGS